MAEATEDTFWGIVKLKDDTILVSENQLLLLFVPLFGYTLDEARALAKQGKLEKQTAGERTGYTLDTVAGLAYQVLRAVAQEVVSEMLVEGEPEWINGRTKTMTRSAVDSLRLQKPASS